MLVGRISDIADCIFFPHSICRGGFTREGEGKRQWVREEGERKRDNPGSQVLVKDTQYNRRRRGTESAVGCLGRPYLGNWHKDKQNDCVVCDHEAVFTQEVSEGGEGVSAVLVSGSVPLTEVHSVGVIDHVRNQEPDILSGKPVPKRKRMNSP